MECGRSQRHAHYGNFETVHIIYIFNTFQLLHSIHHVISIGMKRLKDITGYGAFKLIAYYKEQPRIRERRAL